MMTDLMDVPRIILAGGHKQSDGPAVFRCSPGRCILPLKAQINSIEKDIINSGYRA